MKRYEVLQWAFSFLREHGREEKAAEMLLKHIVGEDGAHFFANLREDIDDALKAKFIKMVEAHALTGVPVQHLIESAHFFGREFIVNEDVLIPRFETEEVVAHAIEKIKEMKIDQPVIADLGTGSGIIAITLALELEHARVYATDISEKALRIAKQNAEKLNAEVAFFHGDFLEPIINEGIDPDVIVANPPYIAHSERDALSDTVKFDPDIALFAEREGLAAYETILAQMKMLPARNRRLVIFEIGHLQGEKVKNLVKQSFPESDVSLLKDINGKDRIISATIFG